MDLALRPGELAICRLAPDDDVPGWARGTFLAIVRTDEELSIVCDTDAMPKGLDCSRTWRALRVAGTVDLSLTGILARVLEPLAEAQVPIFAVSSFDTDYVLVPADRLPRAEAALAEAGHTIA